uniref:lysophospholipid acyltransferase family protein n=1 Tax=Vaginimicrobium propionicum TaxID=1871034 RepID=UPI0009712A84|nr:lysophospholipid acyltransferase family protein [Vaginimicrobium propionicum]
MSKNLSNRYYLGNFWYRCFKAVIFIPLVRGIWRPTVIGADKIPSSGAILAANHLDAGDTISLPASVKPAMIFPAKRELFESKSIPGRIVAWFLKLVGQVPIDRSGGKASASALGPIEEKLNDGQVIGIFPEGSRSPDARLYKGHTGVARLALEVGKPVLPVGLINTKLTKNKLGLPTMKNAKIIIGDPIDYSRFCQTRHQLSTLRWVTNDVMAHIQELTGQEYVDLYSSRVKRGKLSQVEIAENVKETPTFGMEAPDV